MEQIPTCIIMPRFAPDYLGFYGTIFSDQHTHPSPVPLYHYGYCLPGSDTYTCHLYRLTTIDLQLFSYSDDHPNMHLAHISLLSAQEHVYYFYANY